ncbi:FG-GAP-like repeat-containing protein, partial [Candidatus Eisenbacteria bacterium]
EVSLSDIEPGTTVSVGPFEVTYQSNYAQWAHVYFSVTNGALPPDTLHARRLDLQGPVAPDSVAVTGRVGGTIDLTWTKALAWDEDAILGYKVYRTREGSGSPEEAYEGILRGHRYMSDTGLDPLTEYEYRIAAVDSGGNIGTLSTSVSAYAGPGMATGWPHAMLKASEASPLICELDRKTLAWGKPVREVIFCGERLYAYHGDGSEVVDGDQNRNTEGPFSAVHTSLDEFWAKPAAGDVDADGMTEIVAISFDDETISCWGPKGGEPDWTFDYEITTAWNSPTLADLDEDGTLEIIFIGGAKDHEGIYILDHDGTPYLAGNGQVLDLGDKYLYQCPAVGDVNGDDRLDIVMTTRGVGGNGGLHIIDGRTGNYLTGLEGGVTFESLGLKQSCQSSPTLADPSGSGKDLIYVLTPSRLWCFSYDEEALSVTWSSDFASSFSGDMQPEPVLGDIVDNFEFFGPEVALVDRQRQVDIPDGFPAAIQSLFGHTYGSCILANVDDHEAPEIVFGDDERHVHAYTYEGLPAVGFPIEFSGTMTKQSVAAWDVDNDGYQNLIVQARTVLDVAVYHLDGVEFKASENPWPMRYRDNFNSGRFSTEPPVAVQLIMEEAVVDPQGQVRLVWQSAEPVQYFRILRSGPEQPTPILVGEVPGQNGDGLRTYQFKDTPGAPGRYRYQFVVTLLSGQEEPGPEVTVLVPTRNNSLSFQPLGPSPIVVGNPTRVAFNLPGTGSVQVPTRLRVLDLEGRLVRTLVDEPLQAGGHALEWDGRDGQGRLVPAGLYLLRLDAVGRLLTRRAVLIR